MKNAKTDCSKREPYGKSAMRLLFCPASNSKKKKLLMPLNKVFWAYIIDIMRIIA